MTVHCFTVDVEEYFQVSALERSVPRETWDEHERRAAGAVRTLLDALEACDSRGTFFVLGWLAEREPDMVREIARRGHEVASHGWDHRRVTEQTPGQFRDSVRASKELLERLSGRPVIGFRAPSFSIVRGREWALDILVEEGYRYDSSLYPVRRPGYGYVNGHRAPYSTDLPAGRLWEFPPATLRWLGLVLPAAGGAYFRHFPYGLVRAALRQAERGGVSGTFYLHPWEIDPDQPRIRTNAVTRLRHYGGLDRMLPRINRLLGEFRFTSIGHRLAP